VPTIEREEPRFVEMIERMNAENARFVVHVGDTKGTSRCTDELYARRKAQFERSAHPLIYTPGDNEWTDCRDPANGAYDPARKAREAARDLFRRRSSMGARRIATEVQPGFPENRMWRHGPCSSPRSTSSAATTIAAMERPGPDADRRDAANLAWLKAAGEARARRARWWSWRRRTCGGEEGTFERYRSARAAPEAAIARALSSTAHPLSTAWTRPS
jgi:hypothetical protein